MENSKIINLLHDITQLGYNVQFCQDFEHMLRVEFTEEIPIHGSDFYYHDHIGVPGGGLDKLERKVIECLTKFYNEHTGE